MDSDDPKNSVMLNELSTAYFGAELDGNDFLSGNFCHEVSNGVYESTVVQLNGLITLSKRATSILQRGILYTRSIFKIYIS